MPALPVNISELIYDWNLLYPQSLHPPGPVRLTDETLRDGLQSPSVRDPSIEQKIEILHLMEALGINTLDLGLPGAGPRAVEHVTALAREIVAQRALAAQAKRSDGQTIEKTESGETADCAEASPS